MFLLIKKLKPKCSHSKQYCSNTLYVLFLDGTVLITKFLRNKNYLIYLSGWAFLIFRDSIFWVARYRNILV